MTDNPDEVKTHIVFDINALFPFPFCAFAKTWDPETHKALNYYALPSTKRGNDDLDIGMEGHLVVIPRCYSGSEYVTAKEQSQCVNALNDPDDRRGSFLNKLFRENGLDVTFKTHQEDKSRPPTLNLDLSDPEANLTLLETLHSLPESKKDVIRSNLRAHPEYAKIVHLHRTREQLGSSLCCFMNNGGSVDFHPSGKLYLGDSRPLQVGGLNQMLAKWDTGLELKKDAKGIFIEVSDTDDVKLEKLKAGLDELNRKMPAFPGVSRASPVEDVVPGAGAAMLTMAKLGR